MNGCHDFQELLLDSLYGVLELAEEQALRLHLEQCGGCKEALAEVREQQSLLARAARACPEVTPFVLPTETVPEPQEEPARFDEVEAAPVAATIRPRRRSRRIAVLTAAAAILLAAGFLGNQYRLQLREHETELSLAQNQVKATDALLAQAQADFRRETDRIPDAAEKKTLHVQVVGPARLTADAPAPIRVVTRDLSGQKVPTRLTATLVAGGKELHRQEVASQGDRGLVLPAGMFDKAADAKLLVSARTPDGIAQVEEAVRLEMPAHVAHLATNKSMYQVGEVLFFRVLALESFSLKPPAKPVSIDVSLVDPAGKSAKRLTMSTAAGGIAAGELPLTPELVSGNYLLEVKGENFTPVRRPVELVRDLPPQLQFDRSEYRPGETFSAQYQGRRGPDGKAMPIQDLKVKILVDGKEVKVEGATLAAPTAPGAAPPAATLGGAGNLRTDARGNAAFRAKLPAEIETGKALVEIQAKSGKQQDKLVQSIPVVGSRLAVDFFPEGGNLVAGVSNRVYYRVRTPLGEPVDPEGYVIILSKKDVVLASERNQGLGVFTFTPDVRDSYTLRVTSARGISETVDPFNKLGILAKGIALHVPDAVSDEARPLRIVLHNTDEDRPILVVATCRGRIVAQDLFDAKKGTTEAKLELVPGARGVVRVTVYETGAGLTPVAERLVYRAAAEKLILAAEADRKAQHPGDSVTMKIGARDEKGKATPTWFLAAVVNERVLGPLDRHALSPEASFYLMSAGEQPQDLENADVLLGDSDRARQSLDLYLGSQGWRRFVPAAPAVVAARDDSSATQPPTLFSRENASLATLQARSVQSAQQELARLRRDHRQRIATLEAERAGQVDSATAAERRLAEIKVRPMELARLGLGILILLLLAAGAVGLVIGFGRLLRQKASPTTAFATACGCLLACLLIYGASGSLPGPAPAPGRIELADKGRRGLEDETQQAWAQQKAKAQSPQGVFALAPSAQPSGGFGGARQFVEQRSLQNEAKNSLAKADAQDRNRDGVAAPQISPAMKTRFAEAERDQEKAESYAAKKKTGDAANGKGEASAALLREFTHRNSPKPASEGTLLWHPALFAPDGQARLDFDLPPLPATYRILLYGHDAQGRLGTRMQKLSAK